MANTVGTLNLLQSIVDYELELEKFDTAGTSEEYGNPREAVAHHHDYDEEGSLILHERSRSTRSRSTRPPRWPPTSDDELPRRVRRAGRRHSHVQQLRPAPVRYVTGTIITQALEREHVELGALEPLRDFCFCTDGVRGHLMVAAKGVPGDLYVYGQGANVSMADWAD